MATTIKADTYLQQINTARTQLHACFRRAHELLAVREAHLSRELETIENNYKIESNIQREELQGLKESKHSLMNSLRNNDLLNKAVTEINHQIEKIMELSLGVRIIRFQWNTDFERDIQHSGEIIITTVPQPTNLTPAIFPQPVNSTPVIPQPIIPDPDYKNKTIPLISCCMHIKSTAPGKLYWPHGIAIEPQSGNIYIADTGNHRVQVFTPNGEYCFMFSSNIPRSICVNNNTVYVSEYNHCITLYKLDGGYINMIGSQGTGNGQFISPSGMVVSTTTGHLYVCDCLNHRVQIFNRSLQFHAVFGNNNVKHPQDVNLASELVIVLDKGNPCVHIFSATDYSLLNNIIICGAGKQIDYSLFFSMDKQCNIILADYYKHTVKIFSLSGEFISQIGKRGQDAGEFTNPTGIAIDKQNRIIVVSENNNSALQIF